MARDKSASDCCRLSVLVVCAVTWILSFLNCGAADHPAKAVLFHNEQGQKQFELKPRDDGAKLFDGEGKELARFVRSQSKIKVKDALDKPLGAIVIHADKLRLEAADEKTVVVILHRQADGDWKLEDTAGQRIGTIKVRDYGAELEDSHKKSLYKVKVKSGKTSLRNTEDKAVYTTDDNILPTAMACLGVEQISDVRLRAALFFAIEQGFHQ